MVGSWKRDKRGQFYLFAAVIIIAMIIGFVALTNVSNPGGGERTVYNLGEELNIEGERILDFGTIQANNAYAVNADGEQVSIVEHFTALYDQYTGPDVEVYYIFGNADNPQDIEAYKYGDVIVGGIDVSIGGTFSGLRISQRVKETLSLSTSGGQIRAIIEGIAYEFDLKEGENFYFVISQDAEGERIITTG